MLISTNSKMKLLVISLGLLLVACSPSAEKLNQEGNQAFAQQAYQESLQAYQSAQIENRDLAEPYYNAANALYRQGQYTQALEQLQQALQFSKDSTLSENSLYNLGNSFFNSQELPSAIESYKQALLLNPQNQEAKYNLELALQQQTNSKESQNQPDQNQTDQDQNQSNQTPEQDPSQNNQQDQNQADQGSNSGQSNPDPSQQNQDQETNPDQSDAQSPQDQSAGENRQSGQLPQPGQRMTEEQARQLLATLANDMQTLQERLGQILSVRKPPPVQDW